MKSNGGIGQHQIFGLCQSIIDQKSLTISVTEEGETSKLGFEGLFTREKKRGTPFAMIVARKDGSHWVTIVPHQRNGHFTVIDNAKMTGRRLPGHNAHVAREAIVLRVTE